MVLLLSLTDDITSSTIALIVDANMDGGGNMTAAKKDKLGIVACWIMYGLIVYGLHILAHRGHL